MLNKYSVSAIVLLTTIFISVTIGRDFISDIYVVLITLVCISLLIGVVSNLIKKVFSNYVNTTKRLNEKISDSYNNLFDKILESKKELLSVLHINSTEFQDLIILKFNDVNSGIDKINMQIDLSKDSILSSLKTSNENVTNSFKILSKTLNEQHEKICDLSNKNTLDLHNRFNENREYLTTFNMQITNSLNESFNSLDNKVSGIKSELIENHSDFLSSILQLSDKLSVVCSENTDKTIEKINQLKSLGVNKFSTIINQQSEYVNSLKVIINNLSDTTLKFYESLSNSIVCHDNDNKQSVERIISDIKIATSLIEVNSEKISQESNNLLKCFIEFQNESIKNTNDIVSASTEKLCNKHSETFENIKEQITNTGKCVSESVECMAKHTEVSHKNILDTINANNVEVIQAVNGALGEHATNLGESISAINMKFDNESTLNAENMLSLKTKLAALSTSIEDSQKTLGVQITDMIQQNKLDAKSYTNEVNKKADALKNIVCAEIKEANNNLAFSTSKKLESINENVKVVIKLSEKDKTTQIVHTCLDKIENLHKQVTKLSINATNIERSVYHLSDKKGINEILKAVENVLNSLKTDIKNTNSNFSNQLLDTQILQEKTQKEIEKLYQLVNIISNSKSTSSSSGSNSTIAKILHSQPKQSSTTSELSPNRIETLVDEETKRKVENKYENNSLVKSTMKDLKGKLLYEIEYNKSGNIVRSRNYDNKGNVNVEQYFHSNGQVKYRNEWTHEGKITSEFDINGNKIK